MAAQQLLKIVYALDIKFWVRWCTCSMWRMLLPYHLLFLISIICDSTWEKGPCRANNDFSV